MFKLLFFIRYNIYNSKEKVWFYIMTLLNRKKIFSLFTISSSVFLSGCFNFSCAIGATNNGGGSDQKILNNSIAITALEDNTTVEVKLNGNCRPDL